MPAGVAGPEGRAGYFADPGGIQALDLQSGNLIWRSQTAARPSLVKDNLLAALRLMPGRANVLQFVMLERNERGAVLFESEVIFPDWVVATVVSNESFSYRVYAEGGALILEWEAQGRYRGGAAPSPYIQAQAGRTASGVVRLDLKTEKVEMLPAESRAPQELPSALQQVALFSYQSGASDIWQTEPWPVDGKLAAITGEIAGDEQVLQLRRWNPKTGKLDAPVRLVQGQALVSYVTPDGSTILIHSEIQTGARLPWWIFSVKTGKQLALLNYEEGAREACVLNSHLFYLVENRPPAPQKGGELLQSTIKAFDLVSGKSLWQHSLTPSQLKRRPALRQ